VGNWKVFWCCGSFGLAKGLFVMIVLVFKAFFFRNVIGYCFVTGVESEAKGFAMLAGEKRYNASRKTRL